MENQFSNLIKLSERYILSRRIAKGGMSNVYLGIDKVLDRKVAIKILNQELSEDDSFVESFYQEAKSAAKLSHPNIVTIYDFGKEKNYIYIIMEYVPGDNLKTKIHKSKRFDIIESLDTIIQASKGVGFAHQSGIIHCDIKPQNLLISYNNTIKVADFGIAKAINELSFEEKTNIVWGSPQYISPEQASGLTPMTSSDVYSLGVILYELVTGELPFKSENPLELFDHHKNTTPTPPSKINADIPTALDTIIMKVLSKEPTCRYRNAQQLSKILEIYKNKLLEENLTSGYDHTLPYTLSDIDIEENISKENILDHEDFDRKIFTNLDLITIGLAFLAVLLSGGLIPFWLFIYLTLTQ